MIATGEYINKKKWRITFNHNRKQTQRSTQVEERIMEWKIREAPAEDNINNELLKFAITELIKIKKGSNF